MPWQGSLIANMILGIVILKKRSVGLVWQLHNLEMTYFLKASPVCYNIKLFFCRYSASKYLSIALVSVGIFICTVMSAQQVVSTPGNRCWGEAAPFKPQASIRTALLFHSHHKLVFTGCHWRQTCVGLNSLNSFYFLQNTASEGSEEQGVHAFMHWLIGELWLGVPLKLQQETLVNISESVPPEHVLSFNPDRRSSTGDKREELWAKSTCSVLITVSAQPSAWVWLRPCLT